MVASMAPMVGRGYRRQRPASTGAQRQPAGTRVWSIRPGAAKTARKNEGRAHPARGGNDKQEERVAGASGRGAQDLLSIRYPRRDGRFWDPPRVGSGDLFNSPNPTPPTRFGMESMPHMTGIPKPPN